MSKENLFELLERKMIENKLDITELKIVYDFCHKSDEECAVIKMAERIHNMRIIEYMEESEKKRRVKETIYIFMPVARKLKNEKIINELNNISIKYVM